MINSSLYGLMAEFDEPDALVAAARRAYAEGYRKMDAYTPFAIDGMAEAIGVKKTRVPLIVLIGGFVGGITGYAMQYYGMAIDYPINVGGRPLNSWPAFIPITFEMTVLIAALSAVIGMLALNGLPMPHHPVFNIPEFKRASRDRFFLCIEATDPQFNHVATHQFLESLQPQAVFEVDQ